MLNGEALRRVSQSDHSIEDHNRAVTDIAERVKHFCARQIPFRLYHGSSNTTRQRSLDPEKVIDTSSLSHVVHIDTDAMTCLVEPNVAMDELVDACLPLGVVPPVIMEFPGITVGGGFAGTAGESSGFKYGFFDRIVNWFEIVLPDGHVVTASRSEREDLFHGAAGSFGTLGVATLFELQLVPAQELVEMTYHPCRDLTHALETMDLVTNDPANDFVDGVQYALDRVVVVTGRLVACSSPGTPTVTFSKARDNWFYLHLEETAAENTLVKVCTPLKDYLFRYDRGAFWTGKYAFGFFHIPFIRLFRRLLDSFMHTRTMYHALHQSGYASRYIIQDLLLPRDRAEEFVTWVADNFPGLWPLWLCPLKFGENVSLRPKLGDVEHISSAAGKPVQYVNIGVWGQGSRYYPEFIMQNRRLETKLRELGGIKWLYAQTFYTRDEFWEIYDAKHYEALRDKYQARYLPDVWDKVHVDIERDRPVSDTRSTWLRTMLWRIGPISAAYGVYKTLAEKEYGLVQTKHKPTKHGKQS